MISPNILPWFGLQQNLWQPIYRNIWEVELSWRTQFFSVKVYQPGFCDLSGFYFAGKHRHSVVLRFELVADLQVSQGGGLAETFDLGADIYIERYI